MNGHIASYCNCRTLFLLMSWFFADIQVQRAIGLRILSGLPVECSGSAVHCCLQQLWQTAMEKGRDDAWWCPIRMNTWFSTSWFITVYVRVMPLLSLSHTKPFGFWLDQVQMGEVGIYDFSVSRPHPGMKIRWLSTRGHQMAKRYTCVCVYIYIYLFIYVCIYYFILYI